MSIVNLCPLADTESYNKDTIQRCCPSGCQLGPGHSQSAGADADGRLASMPQQEGLHQQPSYLLCWNRHGGRLHSPSCQMPDCQPQEH